MASWRVTPFNHPKPIVCRQQCANLTQFIGSTARSAKLRSKHACSCLSVKLMTPSTTQWLSWFEDCRRGRGGDRDHCLMIDLWILLIQFCGQTLGLFLFEE